MQKINYQEGVFKSKWLSKFINYWCVEGEKSKIEKIVYYSFINLKKEFNGNILWFFFEVLEQLKPWIGLRLRRTVKSKKKQVEVYPIIITINIQYRKAIYWIVKSIQLRKERNLSIKISSEIKNILFNEITSSLKKKKNIIIMR